MKPETDYYDEDDHPKTYSERTHNLSETSNIKDTLNRYASRNHAYSSTNNHSNNRGGGGGGHFQRGRGDGSRGGYHNNRSANQNRGRYNESKRGYDYYYDGGYRHNDGCPYDEGMGYEVDQPPRGNGRGGGPKQKTHTFGFKGKPTIDNNQGEEYMEDDEPKTEKERRVLARKRAEKMKEKEGNKESKDNKENEQRSKGMFDDLNCFIWLVSESCQLYVL